MKCQWIEDVGMKVKIKKTKFALKNIFIYNLLLLLQILYKIYCLIKELYRAPNCLWFLGCICRRHEQFFD
jgi:hypothetical protein